MANRPPPLAILLGLILSALFSGGCQSEASPKEKALRLVITDVEGLEQLQREFGAFRDLLQRQTQLSIDLFPVSDRTAAVTALQNEQIDLVLTGPAEYVIFRNRTDVQPLVGLFRPDYTAVILVRHDNPAQTLSDLKGQKVAMGPIASTSKHLAPMHMLSVAGLSKDEIEPFHTSVRAGWESLVRGDVTAFATTKDKYLLLIQENGADTVRVIAESGPLPMDVLLSRPGLSPSVIKSISTAIESHGSEFVAALLTGEDNQKYVGMQFRPGISDADYDEVRTMFRTAGLEQLANPSR